MSTDADWNQIHSNLSSLCDNLEQLRQDYQVLSLAVAKQPNAELIIAEAEEIRKNLNKQLESYVVADSHSS